jgi:hypothetical protein
MLQKRDAKKGIVDHSEDAARQGRKTREASQQGYTTRVEIRVRKLGITRELAEYLVDLEMRIEALEKKR